MSPDNHAGNKAHGAGVQSSLRAASLTRRSVAAGAAWLLALPSQGMAEDVQIPTGSTHIHEGGLMAKEPTAAREAFGDIAPQLADISDKVLFGEVWANPALSPRDRSLITIASLISLYRHNELPGHIKRGLENGLTKDEIIATITHLAFYSGWPTAMTGLQALRDVLKD